MIAYVPSSAIKDILIQFDSEGNHGKWISRLMEYDIEIKLTKLVKGQVLAKIIADSNCKPMGLNSICNQSAMSVMKEMMKIQRS